MNKQTRNRLLIVLLVLLLTAAAFFYFRKSNVPARPEFHVQGSTDIPQGNITLKVWDNDTVDGDTVDVYFDNKLIAGKLGLTAQHASFALGELKTGEHTLGVKAVDEGISSPATCSVSLSNGTIQREFVMDAWIDSASSWKIIVN